MAKKESILSRFASIMSANINALLDKCEDPEKMIDQYLRDYRNDLARVKEATADVMATEKKLQKEVDKASEEVSKWDGIARKALTAGNEGDAREALANRSKAETVLAEYHKGLAAAEANSAKMRDMYNKLVDDIKTLEDRKALILAKNNVAKAQKAVNNVTAPKCDVAMTAFDRMEAKVDRELDRAEAEAELDSQEDAAASLEAKYSGASSSDVDAALEALRAEMGL